MNHIHLDCVKSTQDYLLELDKNEQQQYLISTNSQTAGRGRRDNIWDSNKDSLCLSFTLEEHEILTLTSAEISVLVCRFFKENYNKKLKVKWPNDILNSQNQKCGGILIQKSNNTLIVGIGLNILNFENKDYPIVSGNIFENDFQLDKKEASLKLYQFIYLNRLSSLEIKKNWLDLCAHKNKEVTIIEDSVSFKGNFIGLGNLGEAIIKNSTEEKKFFNGTLRL